MIIMAGMVVCCDGRNTVWAVEMLLVATMTVQDDVSSKELLPVVHQKMELVGPHLVPLGKPRHPLEGSGLE